MRIHSEFWYPSTLIDVKTRGPEVVRFTNIQHLYIVCFAGFSGADSCQPGGSIGSVVGFGVFGQVPWSPSSPIIHADMLPAIAKNRPRNNHPAANVSFTRLCMPADTWRDLSPLESSIKME